VLIDGVVRELRRIQKLEEGENRVLGPPCLSHTDQFSRARARRYGASALLPQKPTTEQVRESGTPCAYVSGQFRGGKKKPIARGRKAGVQRPGKRRRR
jgi:hypothetical protein